MNYTTERDFELFKKECKKWIDRLGLHDWEYSFAHDNIDAMANCTSKNLAKIIILRLNKEITLVDKTKREEIKICALHEVLHVLLENLFYFANSREFNIEEYYKKEHSIQFWIAVICGNKLKC